MSGFNIQFCDSTGFVIDPNMYGHEWGEEYAEKDATSVNIWDEDECIATLITDGVVWKVSDLFGWWSLADDLSEKDYAKVSDFVDALNEVLETV